MINSVGETCITMITNSIELMPVLSINFHPLNGITINVKSVKYYSSDGIIIVNHYLSHGLNTVSSVYFHFSGEMKTIPSFDCHPSDGIISIESQFSLKTFSRLF